MWKITLNDLKGSSFTWVKAFWGLLVTLFCMLQKLGSCRIAPFQPAVICILATATWYVILLCLGFQGNCSLFSLQLLSLLFLFQLFFILTKRTRFFFFLITSNAVNWLIRKATKKWNYSPNILHLVYNSSSKRWRN